MRPPTRHRDEDDPIDALTLHTEAGAVRAGAEGWRTLYRELGEPVFRLLHRMTRDEELARDLTQDTFVRVFERGDQFSGTGSLKGWVFQIAANLVRERARTRGRRAELLEREGPLLDTATRDESSRVESRLVLDDALEALPEEQRSALLLYEVDGYTHAEIGEMLGVAEGTSKARVSRAKAALRELLKGRI